MLGQVGEHGLGRDRALQQVALAERAAELEHRAHLRLGLDPLGDDLQVEQAAELHDHLGERPRARRPRARRRRTGRSSAGPSGSCAASSATSSPCRSRRRARPTPSSRSSAMRATARSTSLMIALSVSSRMRSQGPMPERASGLADVVHEPVGRQLARGDVHGHAQRAPDDAASSSTAAWRQASKSRSRAERHDEAGLLRERDELGRRDRPALGVRPARERLDAARSRRLRRSTIGW